MTEVRILSFLCSLVLSFYCILNIIPIALIALEAAIERRGVPEADLGLLQHTR